MLKFGGFFFGSNMTIIVDVIQLLQSGDFSNFEIESVFLEYILKSVQDLS